METTSFTTGDPLFVFDDDLTIRSWNAAAEQTTGIAAREAVGRPCWDVLGGTEANGSLVCHRGCSQARLVREGWPVQRHDVKIRTATGPRIVGLSTIAVENRGERLFLHLIHDETPAEEVKDADPPLTQRQMQVLELIAAGAQAKSIAEQLGISVATVRNHIRSILVELDAHSQLEAIAHARTRGLLRS